MNEMMKTLSWDPKVIKNLGPVGYAAQGSDEYQEFIEKIGILKNMEISISDKGYKGHRSSHYFIENGTYYVEVEVNFDNNVNALFPQMSISCNCKTEEGSVLCTTKQQQGKWMVTFQTADSGSYTIMATLKVSGEDYGGKVETIQLVQAPLSFDQTSSNVPPGMLHGMPQSFGGGPQLFGSMPQFGTPQPFGRAQPSFGRPQPSFSRAQPSFFGRPQSNSRYW